jgi:hypothetical protein
MHVGEYILALVIIVLGLAIADLAISTHRLIRRRADVKFDAAPILAALIAAYLVFLNFWGDYSHFRTVTSAGLWSTLPNLAILFVNFLIAAAALPDEWKGNLDLWKFYLSTRRQFWVLIAIADVIASIYNAVYNWPLPISVYASATLTLIFAAILWVSERRWVHLFLASAFLAMLVFGTRDFVISG